MTIAFANTDEIFAVAMGRTSPLTPAYMYGLATLPILGWTFGTLSGAVASGLLNAAVRSALGVALYSMFVAIVVPPMRQLKSVRIVVAAAVIVSLSLIHIYLFAGVLPVNVRGGGVGRDLHQAEFNGAVRRGGEPVSYTHLDVYKRQVQRPGRTASHRARMPDFDEKFVKN